MKFGHLTSHTALSGYQIKALIVQPSRYRFTLTKRRVFQSRSFAWFDLDGDEEGDLFTVRGCGCSNGSLCLFRAFSYRFRKENSLFPQHRHLLQVILPVHTLSFSHSLLYYYYHHYFLIKKPISDCSSCYSYNWVFWSVSSAWIISIFFPCQNYSLI